MDTQKSFVTRFGEWWDEQRAQRHQATPTQPSSRLAGWLPSRGNVIFTLTMLALMIAAQSVGALPLGRPLAAPDATSTSTIAYQGRLADSAGAPLTGTYGMIFRLYNVATDGTPLWEEQRVGPSSVPVSDGLFNVILGSLTSIPASLITTHSTLYLGITVGSDDEMTPRVQLGSVPFAMQALTVPDGSVTGARIADGAVGNVKLQDGAVSNSKLAPNAVTTDKVQDSTITASDVAFNYAGAATKGGVASDSDKLDGYHSNNLPYASPGHLHDNRYFTEGESDGRFAFNGHAHDDRYFTENESNSGFVNATGDTMTGELTVPRLSSPANNDLTIDAGLGSANTVNLYDNVRVDGDLTIDGYTMRLNGADFWMNGGDFRGDGGRAMVHEAPDRLSINYAGDFAGGVIIVGLHTGAVVEQNLMTLEQQNALSIPGFEQGDLLCWSTQLEQLEKCRQTASPLIVAVADAQGKPIVLGAEPVKVLGPVRAGDLLVASSTPGFAIAWSQVASGDAHPGTVIGKVLEAFEGQQGIVRVLITPR